MLCAKFISIISIYRNIMYHHGVQTSLVQSNEEAEQRILDLEAKIKEIEKETVKMVYDKKIIAGSIFIHLCFFFS